MAYDYFPPAYFSAAYFPNLITRPPISIPDPAVPVGGIPRGRDQDAYAALVEAANKTNAFDQVVFGAMNSRSRGGANRYPMLLISPRSWQEQDDADPISVIRRSRFTMTLRVREEDPLQGFQVLDRLSTLLAAAVDQSSLGGTSLPGLTKVRTARYIPTANPEMGVELEGEFSILYTAPEPSSPA